MSSPNHPGGPIDAFCVTGSSPTERVRHPVGDTEPLPTLHLLGIGKVGRAFLDGFDTSRFRLVGATDSSGTVGRSDGLDPHALLDAKRTGRAVHDLPDGRPRSLAESLREIDADVVVDLTATRFDRPEWARALSAEVLRAEASHTELPPSEALHRKRALVFAAKDSVCRHPEWISDPRTRDSIGINGVLGGAGAELARDIDLLRDRWTEVEIAGNATTTTLIEGVEQGGTIEEGIRRADALGLLESDPELDLRGWDAAVKLGIVVGVLTGCPVDPDSIETEDVRSLSPEQLRARPRRGETTRLIGRAKRDGTLRVRFEACSRDDALAVPSDRVAYRYRLGTARAEGITAVVHEGDGLGAVPTARAVWRDVIRLAARFDDRSDRSPALGRSKGVSR